MVLAGDGSERTELERVSQDLGIAGRVRFLGWRDDVDRLHSLFDLFVMTSRSEGMSVSLLEAMAAGLCPVVTDVGGNRAVLGPELETLAVPSLEAPVLAKTWLQCIVEPEWRAMLGQRARERVRGHYSLPHMVDEHVALYRRLLTGRRSP